MFVVRDVILTYLLTYLCKFLVRGIGHRPRNAIDVYLWKSSPSLFCCIPSPVLLVFSCVSVRCFGVFQFASSLGFPYDGLKGDGFWRFLLRVPYPPPFSLLYFMFYLQLYGPFPKCTVGYLVWPLDGRIHLLMNVLILFSVFCIVSAHHRVTLPWHLGWISSVWC